MEVLVMRSPRLADSAVAFLLAVVVGAVFRKITRLWWMFDDPFHFNILQRVSLFGTLYDNVLYNALGTPLFTPFLMMSLKIDLVLFGGNARPFYIHQLAVVALLPAVEYLLLRLWCSRVVAVATVLITCLAGPTLSVAPILMLRHYIGGAVLAMIATILFVRALREGSAAMAVASAIVYFIAAGTKEIYVPLPALLLVIPERSWRQRIRMLVPHAVAGLLAAAWRLAIIGTNVGSYGFVIRPEERLGRMVTLPFRAVREFAGSRSSFAIALTLAVVACAALLFVRVRAARLPLAVAIAVALIPILPVATELQPRWAFALWLVFSICVAFVPRALPRGAIVVVIVLLLAIGAHATEWPARFRSVRRMSDEARVFVTLGPNDVLRNSETPPVTLGQLASRFPDAHGRAANDDLDLCPATGTLHRVLEYDDRRREIVDEGPKPIVDSCRGMRTMPLSADFTFDEPGSFFWRLGPYSDGTYSFVLPGAQTYEVHRDGGFRSPGLPGLTFRVRYRSPSGWTTYSPDIKVDMIARRRIAFVRK
jgi:hypothetical protein